jgi:hypothetical protein
MAARPRRGALHFIAQQGELIVQSDPQRPSGRLMRQGGMEASYVDLADPGHLEFDYLRWMRTVLMSAHARAVLHIGGAGCALPRALAAADADSRQEVWEIDPDVVAFARTQMGLRRAPGLRVRVGDGAAALAALAGAGARRDAVVIDAFLGARVAPGPTTPGALAHAAELAPLCLVNVVDDRAGRELARVAENLGEAYGRVWSIAGRSQNTVLGADRPDLDRPSLDLIALGPRLARDPSPSRVELID